MVAVACLAGVYGFSNAAPSPFAGQWKVLSTWSPNRYLDRFNVGVNTKITIDERGYTRIGRTGIDGIIGAGLCGAGCSSLTVNGKGGSFKVIPSETSQNTLVMVHTATLSTIVARKMCN